MSRPPGTNHRKRNAHACPQTGNEELRGAVDARGLAIILENEGECETETI